MAKDYWGSGQKSLLPQTPDAMPAGGEAPGTALPAPARPAAKSIRAEEQKAEARRRAAIALDEVKVRPKSAQTEAPGFTEERRSRGAMLPDIVRTVDFGRKLWFAVSFVAPVVIGALYLFLMAPDQYVTEYRFSVRVPVGSQVTPGANAGSFAAVFGGNPNPTTDLLDNYTVTDYVTSAQAARDLDAKLNLREMFNKPFDPMSKVGNSPTAERLSKYWRRMVYANFDPASGLAIVRVNAYTAADSYAIANALVSLSSDVVNSIGTHSQQDSVRFAQLQLDRANAQVVELRGKLADLRRRNNLIDPDKGVVSGNVALINDLTGRRAQLQVQFEMLQRQLSNPQAPQLQLLQQQLNTLNGQIAQARQNGGAGAGAPNMAVTFGQFEELNTRLNNALSAQASATLALATIQTNADAQRLYLTTYVRPAQPESPQAPTRWLDLLEITLAAAMIWVIGRMVGNSIMEHE